MTDGTRALLQLLGGDSWGSNQVDLMVCSVYTGLIGVGQSDRTQCRVRRLGRNRPPPRSGARRFSSQVKQELGQEYRTLKTFSQTPHRVRENILSAGNMVELNLQSSVMKQTAHTFRIGNKGGSLRNIHVVHEANDQLAVPQHLDK